MFLKVNNRGNVIILEIGKVNSVLAKKPEDRHLSDFRWGSFSHLLLSCSGSHRLLGYRKVVCISMPKQQFITYLKESRFKSKSQSLFETEWMYSRSGNMNSLLTPNPVLLVPCRLNIQWKGKWVNVKKREEKEQTRVQVSSRNRP